MSDNENYLTFAKELATEAGKIMRRYFQAEDNSITRKDDQTYLTIADTSINELVIKSVKESYPDHGVLGEEASYKPDRDLIWVVDPIDGTMAYTFGITNNVFVLVLTNQGQPILGVVYDPYLNRLFWAEKGHGAFLREKQLHVNDLSLEDGVVGCSGKLSKIIDSPSTHSEIERRAHRIISMGCVVYEGMLVASGQLVAHIVSGSGAHDCVASKLFVEEAGGKVTDLLGNNQLYNQPVRGILASNGRVHNQLLEIIKNNLIEK